MIKNDISNTAKIVHPETTTVLLTKRSTRRLILGRFQRGPVQALVSLTFAPLPRKAWERETKQALSELKDELIEI
jgi:hypothetical protein